LLLIKIGIFREKAEERVKQLEDIAKRHEKLLAQAVQEESTLVSVSIFC
jgi:hypothetical protein